MNPGTAPDLFTPFYQLKKHCEASIFTIQRTVDEKNIEMLQLMNANSLDTKDRVIHFKVQDILFHQTRRNLFTMALNVSKHLILNYIQFEAAPTNFTVHLETLLWILDSLGNVYDLHQIRYQITLAYGKEKLAELEEFNNIDQVALEVEAQPLSEGAYLEEYTKNIQEMLSPWVDKKPVISHMKTMPNLLNQSAEKTPQARTWKLVQEVKPKESGGGLKLNLNNNNNSKTAKGTSTVSTASKESARGASKGVINRMATVSSTLLKPEEECLINTSSSFDFNQVTSNLKISTIKGLCRKNLEYFDQIEPQLIKDGILFEDPEFSAEMNSLTLNVAEFPIAEHIVWKRLKDVYLGEKLTICSDSIGPNDIQQGQLGACYLLSALSVLSEQKGFIKRLFHSKKLSEVGCYSIWLCDSGEWKNVIIDDSIPCLEGPDGKAVPCFSKSKSTDIWVVLLEKAFAKLFGNYHNIDGGCLADAMSVLTGAPTKFFKEKSNGKPLRDQLWMFIKESLKSNFPVTAATRGESLIFSSAHKNTEHIVSNHAYAVLAIKEVESEESGSLAYMQNSSSYSEHNSVALSMEGSEYVEKKSEGGEQKKKTEKLIKVRNPWGISLPGEDKWGKRSEFWTSKIDNQSVKGDEGAFWIGLDDFASHFKFVCACEVHDDYYYSFIRLGETKGQNYFVAKMSIEASSFVYLSIQQKLQKHFRKNDSYQYSPGRVLVGQLDNKGKIVSIVSGKCKGAQSIVIKEKFAKGEYLILIEMEWIQKFYHELVVTAYSGTKVNFTEEPASNYELNSLYESFLKAIINSSSSTYLSKQYELEDKACQIWKFKIEKYGLVCLLYLNKEKDIALNIKLEVQKLENMVLAVPTWKDSKHIQLRVKPNSLKLVLFKTKYKDILENKSQEEYRKISNNEGYAYEYGELSKLSNVYTRDELKALCKQKGTKIQSLKEDKIVVYRYKYLGGLAEYYVNNDKSATFKQNIKFEMQNVLVNEEEPKDMLMTVPTQSDFLLDMKVKDLLKKGVFTRTTDFTLV